MLDKMKQCHVSDYDSQDIMSTITKSIEVLQLKNRNRIFVKEYLYVYKYLVSHLQYSKEKYEKLFLVKIPSKTEFG